MRIVAYLRSRAGWLSVADQGTRPIAAFQENSWEQTPRPLPLLSEFVVTGRFATTIEHSPAKWAFFFCFVTKCGILLFAQ